MPLINSAESNRAQLRYIKEATWGTTPGSGVTREMRITSSNIVLNKDTAVSDEIRADRMIPNIAEVGAMTEGDVEWELSAFSHDDFFQAFLLGAWSLDMNGMQVKGSQVSITGTSQITIAGVDMTKWLTAGQYLKLGGFTNVANNRYVTIAVGGISFTGGNTVITTDQTSLVVETGSAYTVVSDARDVILASTAVTFTSGNTIDGGTNAFLNKTLYVGQKIWVEGLGKETATLTYLGVDPVAGNTVTLSDGVSSAIFEFNTSEDAADPAHIYVQLSGAPGTLRTRLTAAIMDQFRRGKLRISAADGAAGTKEAGSIAFATTAEVGDQFTVNDGETSVQFTFVASGATGNQVNIGVSANESAENLAAVINASTLNVTADGLSTPGTCAIVNDNFLGGSITEDVDTGTDITTTNFSGGAAPTTVLTNHRLTGGSTAETGSTITAGAFSGGSATKGGFYTISALPDADTIVVSETLTADANSGSAMVVIKGSHLRNPGTVAAITKQSFSIETGFTDVSQYFESSGLRVGGFEMNVEAGSIVTGSFSFMGRGITPSVATVLGNPGTYDVLPTTATEILNATANVGQIEKNGTVLSTAIRSITLSGDATLRNQPAVGEKFPAGIGYGRFMLEGSISAYFENLDFYYDFLNHETISLSFDFEDVDHNKYFFRIPAAKVNTDPISPEGIDEDVMENMDWQAQRDPVLNTQFMIDRFSSVYPFTATA